ncbi:helix-turn-helix transcriptional regulator [Taklimakanibacter lacteus]|uniref:helix-turn-helix transcriptional regulator n=1 Tax=Taklimakanibacter lacteus TaxID=2268456 RepID=UPI000E66DF9D
MNKIKGARVGSPVTFAWAAVAGELKSARLSKKLTIRDLASEVGCDHTVIFRLERSTPVAVEHLLSLLLWLGREPFQFTAVERKFKSKLAPSIVKKIAGKAGKQGKSGRR